jgi:hypothetical protein
LATPAFSHTALNRNYIAARNAWRLTGRITFFVTHDLRSARHVGNIQKLNPSVITHSLNATIEHYHFAHNALCAGCDLFAGMRSFHELRRIL